MASTEDTLHDEPVDDEWINLLITARGLGITPDEIRRFLSEASRFLIDCNNSDTKKPLLIQK